MAVQPNWVNMKPKDFAGSKTHTDRIDQFISQFQTDEKFLTDYGLVHLLEIRFTISGVTTDYHWSTGNTKNPTNKATSKKQIKAEWMAVNNTKKAKVEFKIQLWKSSVVARIPLNSFKKTSAYGGKLGTKLNKGTQFEKDFYAQSVKLLEGDTKGNGYLKTIKAMDKHFGAMMKDNMTNIEGKDESDSGKQKVSLSAVLEEGSANQSRPIKASNGGFIISTPGGATEDIGKTVTDITYFYGEDKKPVYLSLKYGPTLTFFNSGVGDFFPSNEVISQTITTQSGLNLLKMFDIDPLLFSKSFQPRTQALPNKKATNIDKSEIKKLLKSGIGYGYWMVHNDGKGNIDWYEMTKQYMNSSATITGDVTIYYGRKNGKGIGVNMTCESTNYKFTFNIRNKQASGPFPTHMMCDYKKKEYPDERSENGVA
tara:strand:+ start:50 stop:1324 length:1275 start_codon:yes stop_codon:yes gene_type:complete